MIGDLISPGWSLLEKTKWFREAGLDTGTVKRLVLIECRKNLSLMEPLKLKDSSIDQDASAIVAVAARLQFEAIEYLLTGDDKANKAFEELAGIPFETTARGGDNSEHKLSDSADSRISLIERLLRLYVRMYSVKTFAEIALSNGVEGCDGTRQVQFRKRLRNIQKVLLALESAMSGEASV